MKAGQTGISPIYVLATIFDPTGLLAKQVYKSGPADVLEWSSTVLARPVCLHEGYSNFFCFLGRAISSERL